MVTDDDLNQADSDSLEVWAPTHAWRALGQLGAQDAVKPLLDLLDNSEDDWSHDEIPIVMSLIGPSAIPAIQSYLADPSRDPYGRYSAISCFEKLGKRYPQEKEHCIDVLAQQLANFKENDPSLNGFLISGLCHLDATDKASDIRSAFAARRVDYTIIGDWDEVQVQLGLKTRNEVPVRRFSRTKALGPLSDILDPKLLRKFADAIGQDFPEKQAKQRTSPQGFGSQSKLQKSKKTKKK
ncbi:MAG: PBS lyase [Cyanobacteria bacterium P01_C01_bin.118]